MSDTIYPVGYIYKLYSHINEHYYLGSTNGTLRQRKSWHLRKEKVSKKVADWIDDIGKENVKIEELHKYENLTQKQLKIYEDGVIREHLGKEYCLNCNRAYVSREEKLEDKKQWYQDHKEECNNRSRQWYQDNKEECINRSRQWYQDNKEECTAKSRQYHHDHG